MKNANLIPISVIFGLSMLACGEEADSPGGMNEVIAAQAVATYSDIAYATYTDSLNTARNLDTAINALVANPTAQTLEAAKMAWLAAREPYLQTEVFRFYGGPIDNDTDGPEGLLNAWPMDEAYVDYVEGDPSAGIIN